MSNMIFFRSTKLSFLLGYPKKKLLLIQRATLFIMDDKLYIEKLSYKTSSFLRKHDFLQKMAKIGLDQGCRRPAFGPGRPAARPGRAGPGPALRRKKIKGRAGPRPARGSGRPGLLGPAQAGPRPLRTYKNDSFSINFCSKNMKKY